MFVYDSNIRLANTLLCVSKKHNEHSGSCTTVMLQLILLDMLLYISENHNEDPCSLMIARIISDLLSLCAVIKLHHDM
ncbi:hypothetical protein SUGI_0028440 [Cryptomeria japonica]|nr:hypothetical protein SUGI_0028440 [Cryptomeria japonica]